MSMASDEPVAPAVQRIVEAALAEQKAAGHAALGAHHWLIALVERHGPMAEGLAEGLNAAALAPHLRGLLRQGQIGEPLAADTALARARERARARGAAQVFERDIASVILQAGGYRLVGAAAAPASAPPAPLS